MLSRKFLIAVKLADEPMYRLAQKAQMHPSTLSQILHGIQKVKPSDPRILRIAKIVGLQENEIFD